ncbi:MAG: hypothetical protein ACXW2D_11390 [Burkholderiaceae bacterium]
MNRRAATFMLLRGVLSLALFVSATAGLGQRVTQPIYRPRPGRPDVSPRPGRLDPGGVNYGSAPGVFTVVSISARDNRVRLRDDDGNAADVYVNERLFDVEALSAGDVVAVDFFVKDDNDDRIEVASIEKLELVSR